MFSLKHCQIFQYSYSLEHLQTAAFLSFINNFFKVIKHSFRSFDIELSEKVSYHVLATYETGK